MKCRMFCLLLLVVNSSVAQTQNVPPGGDAPSVSPMAGVPPGGVQNLPAGTSFRDCDVCPEMVVVPAGSFTMGSNESKDSEKPAHPVKFARQFAVGKYVVTFDEWDACMREQACTRNPRDQGKGRGRRPVVDVSWSDATQYTQWLSSKTGKAYRLLNEAEWEYVARAGTTPAPTAGADGRVPRQVAPVGSHPSNAFGIFDMRGYVFQWTEDLWNENYDGAPGDGSAWASGDYRRRVVRGGSENERITFRSNLSMDRYTYFIGFRVARSQ